jgi:hypothetical protein
MKSKITTDNKIILTDLTNPNRKYQGDTEAVVIMVNHRYFHNYENNRVTFSWSLAGARLFEPHIGYIPISKYENILKKKGYKPDLKLIKLVI